MGVQFFESMRGELIDSDGVCHPADFDLKAEANRLRTLVRNGVTRITGIVRARPWADDLPLEGTLTLSPRRLVYDFAFRDADERAFRFLGVKTIDPLHLLHSMTHLDSRLECEGEVVATGELRFHLDDLPSFAAAWDLVPGAGRIDLDGAHGGPHPALLGPADLRLVEAYAEALIAPGTHVPAVDAATAEEAAALLPWLPPTARFAFKAALRALDAAALARHGRRFAALSLDRRRRLLEVLNGPLAGNGALHLVLGFPVRTAHFGRRGYLAELGLPPVEARAREPDPPWTANIIPAEQLETETELEADVVVIGSGAGGGPMAARLAEAGLAVAVIEEGRRADRTDFTDDPEQRVLRYWRNAGMTVSLGNSPVAIPTGRLLGGTTAINSGTCFATPDAVLEQWRAEHGLPDDFAPDRFRRWLEPVLAELAVEPAPKAWLGDIAAIVARGAEALGAEHGPLPRNAPGCDGQGTCAMGCPTGAKRSTDVSYIPRALRAGASVFTGLPVTRLLTRGERVVAVEARGQDRHGAPRRLRIRARAVVVAAGTFGSPLLLRANGVRLPWLGRNLSIHPALGMLAICPGVSEPWNAIPQSYGVHDLVDPRIRFEGFYAPPQLNAPAIPEVGEALTRWMDAQANMGQFGFMVRDRNVGSVRRGPDGQPLIRYDLTPDTVDLLRRGAATLAELLLRGGADEVMAGVGPFRGLKTVEEARAIATHPLKARDFRCMAFHPLGTCRMGRDAASGVVDSDHRVFGSRNLYVVDGSSVPTSLGVNPQVTIMAMAERAAERLTARLG